MKDLEYVSERIAGLEPASYSSQVMEISFERLIHWPVLLLLCEMEDWN